MNAIEQVLDLARWAPSGDNTQCWRFEIKSAQRFFVHGFDTRDHCVYDLDGRPSQISLGALLATIEIAATAFGHEAIIRRDSASDETRPLFDVELRPASIKPHPLLPYIRERSVQRRRLSTRALRPVEKQALEMAAAPFQLVWLEGWKARFKVARLLSQNAQIRLTMREAYEVHRSIIVWKTRFSEKGIPDSAVGLDPLGLMLMRWAMRDWRRVDFLNRYMGGTLLPRMQLDFLPALACGAHVAMVAESVPKNIDDYVEAGRAVQRFWLTATALELRHQPEMTPLIFARYVREGLRFSTDDKKIQEAARVSQGLTALLGADQASRAIWFGRVGAGAAARSRSTRMPLTELTIGQPPMASSQ